MRDKNTIKYLFSILLTNILLITVTGCGGSDENAPKPEVLSESLIEDLQGAWERSGYGEVILINQSEVIHFEFTRETCLVVGSGGLNEFAEILVGLEFDENLTRFSFVLPGRHPDLSQVYHKLMRLPDSCNNSDALQPTKTDTFRHLWHNFNDYYAFFDERNVDWSQQYETYQRQVSEDMSGQEFFQLLSNMLEPLNDGHVLLQGDNQFYTPAQPKLLNQLQQEYEQQSDFTEFGAYAAAQFEGFNNILTSYMDGGQVNLAGGPIGNLIQWGSIANRVAYVYVQQLQEFAATEDSTLDDDLAIFNAILDRVIEDTQGKEAVIIDLRFNSGGEDTLALAFANRFFENETLLLSKAARSYAGLTDAQEIYSQDDDYRKFTQPVFVLTSYQTASAAEVLCLALKALPNVTFIGSYTAGAFSDVLEKQLPNNWAVSLSNEVYYDIYGQNHEAKGLEPDYEIEFFTLEDRQNGRDSMIKTALQLIGIVD